jgi:hypothetical protein
MGGSNPPNCKKAVEMGRCLRSPAGTTGAPAPRRRESRLEGHVIYMNMMNFFVFWLFAGYKKASSLLPRRDGGLGFVVGAAGLGVGSTSRSAAETLNLPAGEEADGCGLIAALSASSIKRDG